MQSVYITGSRHIILHARKAWLNGLSPKENRTVPPLDYARVYALKEVFPDLAITINGGILTIDDCLEQLQHVEGVMLGRAIMDNPYLLASVDSKIYGVDEEVKSRDEIFETLMDLRRSSYQRVINFIILEITSSTSLTDAMVLDVLEITSHVICMS